MFSIRSFLFCFAFLIIFSPCFGMKCESNKRKYLVSIIDDTIMTCPPLFGDKDDKFCCSRSDGSMYCCDASQYMEEYGTGFLIPMLVSVLVAIMVVCCVCCLCCPCCLWYKRRNRGTVYNNVPPVSMTVQPEVPQHGPQSDVYQQQPMPYPTMPMPQPNMGQPYPPVPPHGVPMQQQYQQYPPYPPAVPPHGQMPPPYNDVAGPVDPQGYSRQAPYNPNY